MINLVTMLKVLLNECIISLNECIDEYQQGFEKIKPYFPLLKEISLLFLLMIQVMFNIMFSLLLDILYYLIKFSNNYLKLLEDSLNIWYQENTKYEMIILPLCN